MILRSGPTIGLRTTSGAAPLAKLARDMGRAFATGLPPLRDFADSLSRYRYLVARAQLADLARLTLGSRPPELLRQRLLRLPAAPETPPLRSDAAPRASRSRAWPRAARATFPDPLLARQAAKRSAERPSPLLRPALCSAAVAAPAGAAGCGSRACCAAATGRRR